MCRVTYRCHDDDAELINGRLKLTEEIVHVFFLPQQPTTNLMRN